MATPGDTAGFDCEFVEKPPSVLQSECPVCLHILRDPYQAPCCGYSFCHSCVEQILAKKKPCPTCKEEDLVIFHNKGLERSLYAFQVYCSHKSKGCDWKGELGQLDNHLSGCPMVPVDCDFHHVGCDVSLLRKDMPAHLNENLVTHMSLQPASHSKLLDKVKQGVPIPFVMTDFAEHREECSWWESVPFYTHPLGYKFRLEVYVGDDFWVFLSVCLMRGEFDDHLKFPFRGDITVEVFDQEGGEEHVTRTISYTKYTDDYNAGRMTEEEGREGLSIGIIPHGHLEPKYLKNDRLCFRVMNIHVKV